MFKNGCYKFNYMVYRTTIFYVEELEYALFSIGVRYNKMTV
jgi:hypothetical protein